MKLEAVAVRNFRSLKRASLEKCSDVNVLIGKNNAGKSSILAAIEFAFEFVEQNAITTPWTPRGRPADEISGRIPQALVQIGIQLRISPEQSMFIRDAVASEVEGVEVALKALENQEHLTIIVAGRFHDGLLSKYIQEIAIGSLIDTSDKLTTDGTKLLSIPDDAALELVVSDRRIARLRTTIDRLGDAVTEVNRSPVWRQRERSERTDMRYYMRNFGFSQDISRRLEPLLEAASTPEELSNSVNSLGNELRSEISQIQDEPLKEALQAFTGAVRKPPPYIQPILGLIGKSSFLHFKETRQAIGTREAEQLLKLKTTRGGPERLASLQTTVRSLLGVAVDAFDSDEGSAQAIRGGRSAEIDIDEFLVEANGAGIREALRIILDLELERPAFALIEEPEVHLHPGLEKVLHRYLVDKGSSCQVFVATHSTNFIDVSTQQNVYLVSRDKEKNSNVELAINEDDVLKIPGDIGVRPSSVLMFDRLLFVEGPSDEAVILSLAKLLEIDLSAVGLGIVQMGGASNSQHFASEATLSLLSRRQIPMTFLLDRDEREETEIDKAAKRLGDRATMHWLKKRELENYLLVPSAVQRLIELKLETSSGGAAVPSVTDVATAIIEEADKLKEVVASRMISKKLMTPVYVDRLDGASQPDKLATALAEISARIENFADSAKKLEEELRARWAGNAASLAPGSVVLDSVLQRFKLKYNKTGDAARLAAFLVRDDVDREIKDLLGRISKPG